MGAEERTTGAASLDEGTLLHAGPVRIQRRALGRLSAPLQQDASFSAALLVMCLLLRRAATTPIVVGFDGIRLRASWTWPAYVPKSAIRDVRVERGMVMIDRQKGDALYLPGSGWASAQAIVEHIQKARRVGRIPFEDALPEPERFAALGDSEASATDRVDAWWALRAPLERIDVALLKKR